MYYKYQEMKNELDDNVLDNIRIDDNILYLIQRKIEKEVFKEDFDPQYVAALQSVLNTFKQIKEQTENNGDS